MLWWLYSVKTVGCFSPIMSLVLFSLPSLPPLPLGPQSGMDWPLRLPRRVPVGWWPRGPPYTQWGQPNVVATPLHQSHPSPKRGIGMSQSHGEGGFTTARVMFSWSIFAWPSLAAGRACLASTCHVRDRPTQPRCTRSWDGPALASISEESNRIGLPCSASSPCSKRWACPASCT